ncbi:MAG: hypothetical protein WC222_08735 [Parachlamydiales bacterium]|jgi:hypothetical protein
MLDPLDFSSLVISEPFTNTDFNSWIQHLKNEDISLSELLEQLLYFDAASLVPCLDALEDQILGHKLHLNAQEVFDSSFQQNVISLCESKNYRLSSIGFWIILKMPVLSHDPKLIEYLLSRLPCIVNDHKSKITLHTPMIGLIYQLLEKQNIKKAILCLECLHTLPQTADLYLHIPKIVLDVIAHIGLLEDEKVKKAAADTFSEKLPPLYGSWSASTHIYLQILHHILKPPYTLSDKQQSTILENAFYIFEGKPVLAKNLLLPAYLRMIIELDTSCSYPCVLTWLLEYHSRINEYLKTSHDVSLAIAWAEFNIGNSHAESTHAIAIGQFNNFVCGRATLCAFHKYLQALHRFTKDKSHFYVTYLPILVTHSKLFEPDDPNHIFTYWTEALFALDTFDLLKLGKPFLAQWMSLFGILIEKSYEQAELFLDKLKNNFQNEEVFFKLQLAQIQYWFNKGNNTQALVTAKKAGILWKVADVIIEKVKIEDYAQLTPDFKDLLLSKFATLSPIQKVHFFLSISEKTDSPAVSDNLSGFLQALEKLKKEGYVLSSTTTAAIIEFFVAALKGKFKKILMQYKFLVPHLVHTTKNNKKNNEELLVEIWKNLYTDFSLKEIIAFTNQSLLVGALYPFVQTSGLIRVPLKKDLKFVLQHTICLIEVLLSPYVTPNDQALNNQIKETIKLLSTAEITAKDLPQFNKIFHLLELSYTFRRLQFDTVMQCYAQLCSLDYTFGADLPNTIVRFLNVFHKDLCSFLLRSLIRYTIEKCLYNTEFEYVILLAILKSPEIQSKFNTRELQNIFDPVLHRTLSNINVEILKNDSLVTKITPSDMERYCELETLLTSNLAITFLRDPTPEQVYNLSVLILFFERLNFRTYFNLEMKKIIQFCETSDNFSFVIPFLEYLFIGLQDSLDNKYLILNDESVDHVTAIYSLYCNILLTVPSKHGMERLRLLTEMQRKRLHKISLSGLSTRMITEQYLSISEKIHSDNAEKVNLEWKKYQPTIPSVEKQRTYFLKFREMTFNLINYNSDEFVLFLDNYVKDVLDSDTLTPFEKAYSAKMLLVCVQKPFETAGGLPTNFSFEIVLKFFSKLLVFCNETTCADSSFVKQSAAIVLKIGQITTNGFIHNKIDNHTDTLFLLTKSHFDLTFHLKRFIALKAHSEFKENIQKSTSCHVTFLLLVLGMGIVKHTPSVNIYLSEMEDYIKKIDQNSELTTRAEIDRILYLFKNFVEKNSVSTIVNRVKSFILLLNEIKTPI